MARPKAILKFEPPQVVQVVMRGNQQTTIQFPNGQKQTFSNEWLEFDMTKKENQMEEQKTAAEPAKAAQAQPIVGRHGKVSVTVNGQPFDSVRKAFADLGLPLSQKSKTRRKLREEGQATVKHDEKEYNFIRVDKEEKAEGEAQEEEAEAGAAEGE